MDTNGEPLDTGGGGADLSGPGAHDVGGVGVTSDVSLDFVVNDATWSTGITDYADAGRPYKIRRTSGATIGEAVVIDNNLTVTIPNNIDVTGDILQGGVAISTVTIDGANVSAGTGALASLTSGLANTCYGDSSGASITTGTSNVAIGSSALGNALGGLQNVAIGPSTGLSVTSANNGVFIGNLANGTSTDTNQIAIGYNAICDTANQCTLGGSTLTAVRPGSNTTDLGETGRQWQDIHLSGDIVQDGKTGTIVALEGSNLSAGTNAMGGLSVLPTTGFSNTIFGSNTGVRMESAANNTITGQGCAVNLTTAGNNVIYGFVAGTAMLSGGQNTLIGAFTNCGATATNNVACGFKAMELNTGSNNVVFGRESLKAAGAGGSNTTLGHTSFISNTSGGSNVGVGSGSGTGNTTGSNNTFIGISSKGAATLTTQTALGAFAICDKANQCTIGNSAIVEVRPGVDSTCTLGTAGRRWEELFCVNATINTSDPSLKTIAPSVAFGVEFIKKIKPIQFKWRDTGVRDHYGLDAEQIGKLIESGAIPDFGGYIKPGVEKRTTSTVDPDTGEVTDTVEEIIPPLGLRLTEFIAPLIKCIHELDARLAALETI